MDAFVHYLSSGETQTKRDIVIRFFIRVYRVWNDVYLEEEVRHIINKFTKLGYPKGLSADLKDKEPGAL